MGDVGGKPDIVTYRPNSKTVSVYRNISVSPRIFFEHAYNIETSGRGFSQISLADVNLDGKLEIILLDSITSIATVCRNMSTPASLSFVQQNINIAYRPNTAVTTGDFDRQS